MIKLKINELKLPKKNNSKNQNKIQIVKNKILHKLKLKNLIFSIF